MSDTEAPIDLTPEQVISILRGAGWPVAAEYVAVLASDLAAAERVIANVRALAHNYKADEYRDEAVRGVAVLPYASNRYLHLLDDLRAALMSSTPDPTRGDNQ